MRSAGGELEGPRSAAPGEHAGWPARHVLESLWRGGAAALGSPGLLGAIVPGAHADLVVLGGDPRADIRALPDVRTVYHALPRWPAPGPGGQTQ
jgi:imidazolonepropionase-like amidohydrolase